MKSATQCLQPADIKALLAGTVPASQSDSWEEHFSSCESCRMAMAGQVGDQEWWREAEHSLMNASIPEERDAVKSEADERESIEELLKLLGPTDDPQMLGRIGSYEVLGVLGRGGMGVVFKAFDAPLNRFVAIKMLLPHLAASGAARKRFAREGQAVAAVVDDHVMAIHCVDEWQGVPYLVMTYSRGVSLQKRLSDTGPLEVREILRIGMQAAKGLAAAHAQGIVHRDIKPANIFLDQSVERVQLMDFGLARAVDDASLTRTGVLAGTPQYMSPEQARAETVDHRSDLFSLGSVMYAMCTGHAPFRAESSYSVLRLITDKEPRLIREINPDVPEWLCEIISKLMAKQASDRFDSAKQVADLLEDCLAHVQQPTSAPLPASLVPQATTGGSVFNLTRLGVMTMLGTIGMTLLGMVLWQANEPPENSSQQSTNRVEATATATAAPVHSSVTTTKRSFLWGLLSGQAIESAEINGQRTTNRVEATPAPVISNVTIADKTATVSGIGGNDLDCVLRIGKSKKNAQLEWTTPVTGPFSATLTASDQLPSDNGKVIKGMVLTVQNAKSSNTSNIGMSDGDPAPAGEVRFRQQSAMGRADTLWTFADIHCDDGTTIPISILLRANKQLLPPGPLVYEGKIQEWVGGDRDGLTLPSGNYKPVPSATLQLYRVSPIIKGSSGYQFEEIAAFQTDKEGLFKISIPDDLKRFIPAPHTKEWDEWESLLLITTSAPGFATDSITLAANRGLPLIVLARGTSINGRLVDEHGKPVVGAQVTVNQQSRSRVKEMDEWLSKTSSEPLPAAEFDSADTAAILAARTNASIANHSMYWIPTMIEGVITDQDGRFTIDGIVPDDVLDLTVECVGYNDASIKVIGRDSKTVYSRDPFGSGDNIAVHGRNFQVSLAASDRGSLHTRHRIIKGERTNGQLFNPPIPDYVDLQGDWIVDSFYVDEDANSRELQKQGSTALLIRTIRVEANELYFRNPPVAGMSRISGAISIKPAEGDNSRLFQVVDSRVPGVVIRFGMYKVVGDKLTILLTRDAPPKLLAPTEGEFYIECHRAVSEEDKELLNVINKNPDQRNVIDLILKDSEKSVSAKEDTTAMGMPSRPLLDAVAEFNRKMQIEHPKNGQPPLTDEEVIAAISWALMDPEENRITEFQTDLETIVRKRLLPQHLTITGGPAMWRLEDHVIQGWLVQIVRRDIQESREPAMFSVRKRYLQPPKEFLRPSSKLATDEDVPLQDAISAFNRNERKVFGQPQPPLTIEEVIAAILSWKNRLDENDVDDATFQTLQKIARTHMLPRDAILEQQSEFLPGDGVKYHRWTVGIRLNKVGAQTTTTFDVRDQFVRAEFQKIEDVQWGPAGQNGLQAGVRFNPSQTTYLVGQPIKLEFFFRTVDGRRLEGSLPNVFDFDGVEARDTTGESLPALHTPSEVVGGWMSVRFSDKPMSRTYKKLTIVAETNGGLKDAENLASAISSDSSVVRAHPGTDCRVRFTVPNFANGADGTLQTGEVAFRVNEALKGANPTN